MCDLVLRRRIEMATRERGYDQIYRPGRTMWMEGTWMDGRWMANLATGFQYELMNIRNSQPQVGYIVTSW